MAVTGIATVAIKVAQIAGPGAGFEVIEREIPSAELPCFGLLETSLSSTRHDEQLGMNRNRSHGWDS